ncbi:MAG: ATP-binding protein [Chloroflexota bacterium]|nr:ATP-binding protein [Chloroflexota bacterium]
MLKSIRSRLIASYLLVILLAMGIAAGLAWSALDRAFLDVLRENLLAQARRVAQTVEAGDMGEFDVGMQSDPYSQASNVMPGYHTRVIDDTGVVILGPSVTDVLTTSAGVQLDLFAYDELVSNLGISRLDARGREAPTDDLLNRPEVQNALNGEPATEVRSYTWASHRRILYAAYPIRSSGEGKGGNIVSVVYIASPLPRLTLSLLPDYFGTQILIGASGAVLLAGLIGLLLARQLVRPLQQLTDAASALARGEPVTPIPPTSTSELHTLGVAFNTMNTSLTTAHLALAAHAAQREAILNGLTDAVLAADATGEIILANPAASVLLEVAPQSLHEDIRRTLTIGEPHAAEITARNQVIELLTAPLRDEEGHISGAVAVGHDVTAYRQLDRLRTSFVSDVSHELRTPLTAIKGFVETLQDGAVDDPTVRDRFLNTIAVETERLIRLTNELLLLTRADAGRLELQPAPTDLVAAAHRAVAQLENCACEKQVAVTTIEPSAAPVLTLSDADRIHQVLVNLLDNAIKFTPAGGQITISFHRADQQISCTVADTGPGVPADEIPFLFERFYRGDPSRVRARAHLNDESGAGLGLAIARAIVEAHTGRIWVESEPGQGTAITFTLPPAP